jgi:hypothetical protein
MRFKFLKIGIICLSLASFSSADLVMGVFYNPGIKIGVQFGKKTDIVIGFENSVVGTMFYGYPIIGLVGGIEFDVNRLKFIEYWELEGGLSVLGIALGGEWNNAYYHSIRVFGGPGIYLSYKHLFKADINEIGLVGKRPCELYVEMDHGTYVFGKRVGD